MYPRTLLRGEAKSEAEVKVFRALRDQLDDEWEAYHSVSWMMRDHAEGAEDGEVDFVLCHPERGIVCLEVKGGGIECRHGEWFRVLDGERTRVPDPFTQALDHRYALKRKIAEQDGWQDHELFIAHALVFPDITVHELVLAPDAPAEIILDRHDMGDLPAALERALAYHRGARDKRQMPGEEGAAMLRELLARDLLIRVPLASRILDEEVELQRMTFEQASILNRFGRERRLVVYGCAGSGKTMVAVEQARRVAEAGERVLFVCFNKPLRKFLNERFPHERVQYWNFHALCVRLAGEAGVELPKYDGNPPARYWDEELPDALVAAIDKLGPQFDAIFVDEAQDLENNWLDALMLTLADPDRDQVWLFMDANQNVYGSRLEVPDEFRPFELTWNCRNTQAIHNEVIKKFKGPVQPEVIGPEGRPPELVHAADQAKAVAEIIRRLVDEEEILPQDIAVLSAHSMKGSKVGRTRLPNGLCFSEDPPPTGKYVRFSSIRAFKGLEAPVVVLCELEDLDDATRDSQIYVGMSRARNHCIVVAPEPEQ